MTVEPAEIEWSADRAPRATRFDDLYYADADGRAESLHVFFDGNALPERWRATDPASGGGKDFTIAELGFGLGLNFHLAARLWTETAPAEAPLEDATLHYVAFEAHPPSAAAIARAMTPWPELAETPLTTPWRGDVDAWPPAPGWASWTVAPGLTLTLAIGDANARVLEWDGRADAWFLDGFSPAKNPELWGAALMRAVFERTRPGGGFATYTVAGWVRRNLAAAGFTLARQKGYGRKREMLSGRRAE